MKIAEKLIAFGGLVLIGCISLLVSCNPEGITPTPGNYIIQGDQDTGPAFSADGNFIAYLHDDANSNSATAYATGLYIIDRNGNNRKLVLLGVHLDPAWSPDGQWLVFSSLGVIQKCKTNGDSLTTFKGLSNLKYPQFYYPDWSADGKHLLFNNPTEGGGGYSDPSRILQMLVDFLRLINGLEEIQNYLQKEAILFLEGEPLKIATGKCISLIH